MQRRLLPRCAPFALVLSLSLSLSLLFSLPRFLSHLFSRFCSVFAHGSLILLDRLSAVDCVAAWDPWGPCNGSDGTVVECGGGLRTRHMVRISHAKQCDHIFLKNSAKQHQQVVERPALHGGEECVLSDPEEQACNDDACEIDCMG